MQDKIGEQQYSFKPGSFSVAVKVIDNDGLDAMEIVHIKVNGTLQIKEK